MGCLCGKRKKPVRTANAAQRKTKPRQLASTQREQQVLAQNFGNTKNTADRKRKIEILKRQGKL